MRTLHTSERPVSKQGTVIFDPRVPATPSDVYGIMTQRSNYARLRPYAELDQVLHTLGGGGGYVLLMTLCRSGSGVAHSGVGLCTLDDPMQIWIRRCTLWGGVMYS